MKILSILLAVVISASLHATNYYVSANGNDANNGTSTSTPWKTIAKINSRTFLPGDSILFRRGDTWREQMNIPSSGSAGNPITFSAYGTGAKPIINGAEIKTGWGDVYNTINANIWGTTSSNAVTTRAMVIINNTVYSEVASLAEVVSPNKYFIKTASTPDSLFVYNTTDPDALTAEVSKRNFCILGNDVDDIQYVNFTNLDLRGAGHSGLALFGTEGQQFTGNCVVDSCNFYANRFFGCVAYDGHNGNTFKNSTATYNGNGFYSWISSNLTISNCSTAHNIQHFIAPGTTDGHGYGGFTAGNIIVENCESNDDADGITLDAGNGPNNGILRYNYIHDSQEGRPGIAMGNLGAGGTIQVHYNLIVNCGGVASGPFESYTVNAGNVLVYNNTMYSNRVNAGNGAVFLKYGDNFVFKNNIIMIDGGYYKPLFGALNPNLPVSDYNQFYQSDPIASPYCFHYNSSHYSTLVNWVTGTGQDTHSQSGNPLFINKNSDWRLQHISPCINKGVDVGLTRDILGNPIVGLPDMGAFELANAPPTANAGTDKLITLPINTVSLSGSGTDPDGSISAYKWTKISGPPSGTITNVNLVSTTVTALVQGIYQFQLIVTDNNGAVGKDTMKVTVNAAANIPPVANAGNNIVLTLPTNSATLTGSGNDPDGTLANYAWGRVSGPTTFSLGSTSSAITTLSNLVQGIYVFSLTVTDNAGATAIDNITVTVNAAPNQAPATDAGNDINLTLPTVGTTLNGNATDPDGTVASYSWSRVSGPTIFSITDLTSPVTTITGLIEGDYVFRLMATDDDGATDADDVTVTVNAAPMPPTANAGNNIVLTLPNNSTTLTGSGSDPDGTIASYTWSRVSGPTTFTIGSANAATTTLNNLVLGTYVFSLTVTDNSGATATDDLTVTVNPAPNQGPAANAGNNIVLTLPTNSTTLTGSGTDPDGTIASYMWSRVSGPTTFTLGSANAATTTLSGLVLGTYTFRLTVTDNSGATATDDITVTVDPAPQPPTVNAGNNIVLTLPTNSTTLTGSGNDPDGTIATYTWSRVSGPTTFTLGSANTATTTLSNLVQGTYIFRLTVTDDDGVTGTDDLTVTVNPAPNQGPAANAGNNIVLTLPTNSTTLTGSGSDPDGTIASYVWSRVTGPATFTLGSANTSTSALSNLILGTYTFRLTVTDNSGAFATDDIKVTVNAAPNQGPAANAGNNIVLTLPTNSTTLTGSGSDPDGTIASYTWSHINGPVSFTLGSANAATTTLNNLIQGTYTFRLTVTDNSGATATDDITVTVNAAPNQGPAANAGNNIVLTLPTNSTTLTGSGSDPDGTIASYAWSHINGPVSFTLGSANAATTTLNNLIQGTYTFRLTVTDNSGATGTDDLTVTVNPAPNQGPAANAGNNIVLTLPTNSTTLTGSGFDPDGTIASYTWSRMSGPTTFTLGSANTATTTLNNLVLGTYVFSLTVTDNSGATATDDLTVTVNPAPQPPTVNAGNNIVLTLPTNSTTLTGSGSDPDGTIASYTWSRVSGPTTFTIGSANAATTALSNLVLGTYTFKLTVTDNSGSTATDDITVTVNPAPQPPTVNAGNNIVLTLPTNSTTLTGSGTDPDGTIATYTWSRISGPTTFTLSNANTATTALSSLILGTYTFRLTVTDNSGATATDDLTVTVNPAPNQGPAAIAGNNIVLILPTNSTTLTGSGSDPDGTIASYTWSRVSGPTTFTLGSANTATSALSNLVQGTYIFRLTVTDDDGVTGTDDLTVTVNPAPNQGPAANAGNNIVLTLPTNSATLTGSGSDPDGTIASYVWSRVTGPATFTLGSANAATTTLNNLILGTYTFRLTVTDNSGAFATDDIKVTVNAAPNQGPAANAGNNIVLTLPTNSTTLTGSGSDPDGTIASYTWSRVSGPTTFTLGSSNAATTPLNNLVQGTYIFRLAVTDDDGVTGTDDLTVTVNPAPNQGPAANAGNNIVLTLPTNSTTLTGSGSDPDGTIASYTWSRISGSNNIYIRSADAATTTLNNLVLGTYTFRLTVTDNSGATATDDLPLQLIQLLTRDRQRMRVIILFSPYPLTLQR